MLLTKNILANYLGRAWGLLSVLIVTPLYARQLGIAAYGLVGFYATLLTIVAFADLGFTATLNRELARLSADGEASRLRMQDTVRTAEVVYAMLVPTISVAIWLCAPMITDHWLHLGSLPRAEALVAIRLMGLSIALQLPAGLFIGGLLGRQEQALANALQIAWGVGGAAVSLLALRVLAPSIIVFAAVQLIANALYLFAARYLLWNSILPSVRVAGSRGSYRAEILRDGWKYAGGMMAMALLSTATTQADKLTISRLLSIGDLGTYMLATAVASAPLMLATPVAAAVFPRMTGVLAAAEDTRLSGVYRQATQLVSAVIIPVAAVLSLFTSEFVLLWTGSASSAERIAPIARLLVLAQLLQALTLIPYYLALAHGYVRLNLVVAAAMLVFLVPSLALTVPTFGLLGAAACWLGVNLVFVPPYMLLLHRRFAPRELGQWAIRAVALPSAIAFGVGSFARSLLYVPQTRASAFMLLAIAYGVIMIPAVLSLPEVSSLLRTSFVRRRAAA